MDESVQQIVNENENQYADMTFQQAEEKFAELQNENEELKL